MPTYHEVDGIKYLQTTVLIREDLHAWAKAGKINISTALNKTLEDRKKKEEK